VPKLKGFSHIDLTVSDRKRAAAWWQDVMGFTVVNRFRGESWDTVSLMHASGLVVSVMTHDVPRSHAFDERGVGLDHLAFQVEDRHELERWVSHLDAKGIAHSGIQDLGFGPTLVFRDPDSIQLELFVHPSTQELAEMLAGHLH
jgi:catechol-2,3-dioxygenase